MNKFKRLIALLLVVATVLSLMGSAAPAVIGEAAVSEPAVEEIVSAAGVDACPYCEDSLAEDGVTVVHAEGCNAEYAVDASGDVGKTAVFDVNYPSVNYAVEKPQVGFDYDMYDEDGAADFTSLYFNQNDPPIMTVTDWTWEHTGSALWYQVTLLDGEMWNDGGDWNDETTQNGDVPDTIWVLHRYTNDITDYIGMVFVDISCFGKTMQFKEDSAALYDVYFYPYEGEVALTTFVPNDVIADVEGVYYRIYDEATWDEETYGEFCYVKSTDIEPVEEPEEPGVQCPVCGDYDCDKTHIYCPVCGDADCNKTHVYCSICEKYDCGEVHEDIYTPDTAPVIPEYSLKDGEEIAIVDKAGERVDAAKGFVVPGGFKTGLSVFSIFDEHTDVSYKWQVRYDAAEDLWADIRGQQGKGILMSPAMFLSLIEDGINPAIRCVVSSDGTELVSEAIPVTIGPAANMASSTYADTPIAIDLAEGDEEPELSKSYVVVNYVYSDGRTAATTDFAEIIGGSAYSHVYTLPPVTGYKATLNTHVFGDDVTLNGNTLTMNFDAGELTDEYTIFTVTYEPDFVNYTVIHYWQNVDNDKYTEHERETIGNTHKTGEQIKDVENEYPGFYNLLYETPAAAADGSTVMEVYYDRYYYLMTFDLGDMGYGVDPIYARYGDALEIGTPTRAGYTFLGWQLNGTGETIAPADMPTTMPSENREYVAQWQVNDTAKVSVVFWGENPNDEGYSYLTTGVVNVKPGTEYTYANGNTVFLICGKDEHTHTAGCNLVCGKEEHTTHTEDCLGSCEHAEHTLDCYQTRTYYTLKEATPGQAINATRNGVYSYTTGSGWGSDTHYYLYLNGIWYCYFYTRYGYNSKDDTQSISLDCDHAHTDSCYSCEVHEHSVACYSCGLEEHVHNNSCNQTGSGLDSDLWKFVRSETVKVSPDGSSVINVYYDRTTFTMTFKQEGNNGSTLGTITDKWGADIRSRFETVSKANTYFWSTSRNGGSPWTSFMDVMPQENRTYYADPQSGSTNITATYWGENLSGEYETLYTVSFRGSSTITVSKEEFVDIEGFTFNADRSSKTGDRYNGSNFYYDRHNYAIEYFNPTAMIRKTENVPYEASLNAYNWTPDSSQAPNKYEPGSVVFEGWYLNPECTGNKFDFTSRTMPAGTNDGDTTLILYAKWEPVTYTVNYFLTKESLDRGENIPTEMNRLVNEAVVAGAEKPATDPYTEVFAADTIKHGAYIAEPSDPEVSEGYENIHPRAGYDFVGWFYIDENGEEKAFDPHNMPVTQNLNLYAKWSFNKLCAYTINFGVDTNNDGEADIYIADPVSGSGIAGRTYTFSAKGGEELYEGYSEGYFPTVGSHSLVIDITDENGTGANSFTFLYRQRVAVPYTVRYVDKETGDSLIPDMVVTDNKNVVVTENYQYIQGYMPDAYQKTLVVTDDNNSANDVIVFYYTKDDEHSLYVVNHYIQELNGDLTHKGWVKYTSLQNTGDIGTSYSGTAITIDGFTLSAAYTDDYNTDKKINGETGVALPTEVGKLTTTDGKSTISGTLTDKGMLLNFYYTRNLYPYEFRYMLNGTITELAAPEFGKAGYDTTVTEAYKEIVMDLDGDGVNEDYRLYDPTEITKEIHIKKDGDPLNTDAEVSVGQAKINVATFYYVRCTQTMTITKTVLDNSAFSNPDPNQVFDFSLLIHSNSGYHMQSYNYTKSDGTSGTLSPVISAPNTLRFSLKADETITIEGLPTAEYTLTELNVPTGYYDSYNTTQENGRYKLTVDGQLDVTVTNSYEPAKLVLGKGVYVVEDNNIAAESGNMEITDFEFTITFPDGVTPAASYAYTVSSVSEGVTVENPNRIATVEGNTMKITLQKSQLATFINLPTGNYTIAETDYGPNGYNTYYIINPVGDQFDSAWPVGLVSNPPLTRGETTTVYYANMFPVDDLDIYKTVKEEYAGEVWEDRTFTFTVERSDKDLSEGHGYEVLLNDEVYGTATVTDAKTLVVTVTFTKDEGAVLDTAGESLTKKLTIKNLPVGNYTVTEAANAEFTQTASVGYTQNSSYVKGSDDSDLAAEVALPCTVEGATPAVAFENTVKRSTGNLQLSKRVVVEEGHQAPADMENEQFEFIIELTDGTIGEGYELTVKHFGTDEKIDTIDDTVVYATKDAAITEGALKANTDGTLTLYLKHGQYANLTKLPIGSYTVTEKAKEGYGSSFNDIPGSTDAAQDITITKQVLADKLQDLPCYNRYPHYNGTLVVKKSVVNAGKLPEDVAPADAEFAYTVTLTSVNVKEGDSFTCVRKAENGTSATDTLTLDAKKQLSFSLKHGEEISIEKLPTGDYTVTETGDHLKHYTVISEKLGDDDEVIETKNETITGTIAADDTDTIVFTNTYKQHLANLTISKTRTGSTSEAQSFVFDVKGVSSALDCDHNGEVTAVNMRVVVNIPAGYSEGSVTVYGLPVGNYTVTEVSDWSWRYVPKNASQTIVLSDHGNVSFTNTLDKLLWLSGDCYANNHWGNSGISASGQVKVEK